MSAFDDLNQRTKFLRNAAPQAYEDFFRAFSAYTWERYGFLVMATPENIQVLQGHAQQCQKILEILEGAKNG